MEQKLLKLIQELSTVRLYSACGVMKGVMVRDKEKVFELVKEARKILEEIENTEAERQETLRGRYD